MNDVILMLVTLHWCYPIFCLAGMKEKRTKLLLWMDMEFVIQIWRPIRVQLLIRQVVGLRESKL